MAYVDQGIDQRAEVLYGATSDTLVYWAKNNGAPVTLDTSSGFVTLSDNGGAEKVARAACSQAANGKLYTTRAWASDVWQLQEDAIALFEWQVSGVTFQDRLYFDVVKNKLICPVDTSDLLDYYPDLEDHLAAIGETNTVKFIMRAWGKLLNRIRSGHNRPSLILDKSRLIEPAVELTLYLACRALSRVPEDLWAQRMHDHREDYKVAIAGLGELKYDRNEDGIAEQNEVKRINRRKFTV